VTFDRRDPRKPRISSTHPIRSLSVDNSPPGVVVVFQQTTGNAGRLEITLRTRPTAEVTVFMAGNHAHVNFDPSRIVIDPARATSQYFINCSLRFDEQYPSPADGRYSITVSTGSSDLNYNSKNSAFAGFFINSGGRANSCVLPFLTLKQFNEQ